MNDYSKESMSFKTILIGVHIILVFLIVICCFKINNYKFHLKHLKEIVTAKEIEKESYKNIIQNFYDHEGIAAYNYQGENQAQQNVLLSDLLKEKKNCIILEYKSSDCFSYVELT